MDGFDVDDAFYLNYYIHSGSYRHILKLLYLRKSSSVLVCTVYTFFACYKFCENGKNLAYFNLRKSFFAI